MITLNDNPSYNIHTTGINNIYYICIDVKMYAILYPTDEHVVTNDNPAYNIHTSTGIDNILYYNCL